MGGARVRAGAEAYLLVNPIDPSHICWSFVREFHFFPRSGPLRTSTPTTSSMGALLAVTLLKKGSMGQLRVVIWGNSGTCGETQGCVGRLRGAGWLRGVGKLRGMGRSG